MSRKRYTAEQIIGHLRLKFPTNMIVASIIFDVDAEQEQLFAGASSHGQNSAFAYV